MSLIHFLSPERNEAGPTWVEQDRDFKIGVAVGLLERAVSETFGADAPESVQPKSTEVATPSIVDTAPQLGTVTNIESLQRAAREAASTASSVEGLEDAA